jgi:hypothetical protein
VITRSFSDYELMKSPSLSKKRIACYTNTASFQTWDSPPVWDSPRGQSGVIPGSGYMFSDPLINSFFTGRIGITGHLSSVLIKAGPV